MSGFDLFERLSQTDTGRNILDEFHRAETARVGGYERSQTWLCEDGYIIEYTTTRVEGGPHDGKFAVLMFKPVGKGARGGRKTAQAWQRTYIRGFAKRKSARARAEELWEQHNETP